MADLTLVVAPSRVVLEVASAAGIAGPDGPAGVGVPEGGTDGQVLAKDSSSDYDTAWITPLALSSATPAALGTAAAGSDSSASKADHVHAMPSASDVGADATGTAAAALAAHVAAGDPHPLYRLEAAAVPWSELSGIPLTFAPSAHASDHASGGSDPVTLAQSQVTSLTSDLAARALAATSILAGTGLSGGGTLAADRTLSVAYGSTGGTACEGNDARLSDARTPTAHASSHAAAGSDPLTLTESQITNLTSDLAARALTSTSITAGTGLSGGGTLAADRTLSVSYGSTSTTSCVGNDSRLSDTRTPTDNTVSTAKIVANAVTNAKLAQVATATIKGRTTAGTGDPEDLTAAQATALLSAVVGDSGSGGTKGLVPAPASGDGAAKKVLQADATWGYAAAVRYSTATFSGTGTHTMDFGAAQQQFQVVTCSASLTLTLDASNVSAGQHVSLIIANTSGGTVTLSWSSLAATPVGAALPTTLAAGKTMALAFSATGTTAASIIVSFASQP